MTTSFSIALLPLVLLALIIVGIITVFIKLGSRGRIVIVAAMIAVLVAGILALVQFRVQARDRIVSTGINSYPPTSPTLLSSNHSSLADEVHRTMAELNDNVARQQAELREKLAEQQAEMREQIARQQAQVRTAVPDWKPPASAETFMALEGESNNLDELPHEPWKPTADLGFEADVHPSAAAAAEALVVQMLKLKDASHPDVTFKRVQIWGGEGIDGEVLSRAVARLQRSSPTWDVMVEAAEPGEPLEKSDREAASIRLEVPTKTTTHQAPWDCNRPQIGGILRLRMTWQGGSIDRSTNFTHKPWVENASQFISEKPEMRWVVGFSSQDAKDTVEARKQAISAAAKQITPEIQKLVESRSAGRTVTEPRWLTRQVEQRLWTKYDVRDEFTQTLITPYGGQVTRQAILVQSPALVQRVASDCLSTLSVQRKTWAAMILSAAGLLVLVCVVGLLLNNVTKGYYRGRIIAMTGLLAIVGLMLFLKLLSMHNSGFL